MSCDWQADAAVSPTLSVLALYHRAAAWLRLCRQRRQERAELLAFIANDHRAAADIGITKYEAMSWSNRPLWRA